MNTHYWSKTALYRFVDDLRCQLHVPFNNFPICSKWLALGCLKKPQIEQIAFPNKSICGILYKGKKCTSIALNSNRNEKMQNLDCMHEVIHYYLHDTPQCRHFYCDENRNIEGIEQNSYIEWQANEGAAQFLVPYQDFIPQFVSLLEYKSIFSDTNILRCLAERYGVTEQVISFRVNNLSYEIDQYRNGVSIDTIDLLSANQQRKKGIVPTGYADACEYRISIGHPLAWDAMIG